MTTRKKVNEEQDKAATEQTNVTFVTCLRHNALRDGSWETMSWWDKEVSGNCHGQLL
jgi:hypothetical protein